MKIAVTGGNEYTDFLLGILAAGKNRITVIDRDQVFCERVCSAYDVEAIFGDPCEVGVLKDAGIRNFDVIVAMGQEDTDNFEICQMGKKVFGIQRAVCLVRNPRNVELFERLGIDQAVNVSVMIAEMLG